MPTQHTSKLPAIRPLTGSRAFREAALRSEVRRAYAVMGMVVLVYVLVIAGESRRDLDDRIRFAAAIGLGVLFALQLAVLAFARWARRRERVIPNWFIVLTVCIEGLIPTGMILANILPGLLPPYAALSSPPILAYGLLLSLTTLRLRPDLCVVAGVLGAAGYSGLLLYVTYGLKVVQPTTGLPRVAYVNSAMLILISGVAAAWVAREIRRHAEAALGEVEMRRQLDRIEHDLSVARSIQRALLPRAAPDIPGFDIAGWNRPADQTGRRLL
jgi:hypothetical protein